jgi:ATP-binding cassette subfamily B protein/subfamily B ATP-binding cassette protein MsbA
MATFQSFIEFTSSMGTIVVIYFGGRLAFNMVLPIEDLVAYFLYLEMFYQPIRMLTAAWEHTQEAVVGAERVQALLDEEPDIQNGRTPLDLGRAEGRIQFSNVSFRYTRGEPVLEELDLHIQPRTVTALVGPTGVGKTTLASLIPRFYDATDGSVMVDGVDVRELDLQSLRSNISLVLQDVFLFNGTVRDNILFGNPAAGEKDVRQAAEVANADEFIRELSEGYDTRIGERGVKLSGGQKQRISIARAVLKDAPILILDEATSSVDTYTEVLIQQALERLMQGRTTIVIAHRLSTIRKADQIVVLADRKIREIGTHDDLIERGGIYHRLSTMQAMV